MKRLKKIINLILIAIIVAVPSITAKAADKIEVPISVEWFYKGRKWARSPHTANVVIEPVNNAPSPKTTSFNHAGDYIVMFKEPNFSVHGRYEYLIYQNNKDFTENSQTVSYDKTRYRLIFFVQKSANGLATVAYAYDDSKYNDMDLNANKEEKIVFKNDDPYIHRHDGYIVEPGQWPHPYDPSHPIIPHWPYNPNDPNPNNPPLDPTNPNRDKTNTPIYSTDAEESDKDKPINQESWNRPSDNPTRPTPGPTNPAKPVVSYEREKPWWWDYTYPNHPYDPENPVIPDEDKTNGGDEDSGSGPKVKPGEGEDNNEITPTNPEIKNPTGDDENTGGIKNPKSTIRGSDKDSQGNVKTGVESLGVIALILLLALAGYKITGRKLKGQETK